MNIDIIWWHTEWTRNYSLKSLKTVLIRVLFNQHYPIYLHLFMELLDDSSFLFLDGFISLIKN